MYTSGTVWLWGPVLCLGRIFVGSAPVAGLLFFGTKYYCFRGLRPFGSGSRFWSYTVRDRLSLKEKQGVDVVTLLLLPFATLFRSRKLCMTLKGFCLRRGPGYCLISSLTLGGLLSAFILVIGQSWGQRRIRGSHLLFLRFLIVIVLFSVFPGFAVALGAVFALPSPDVKWWDINKEPLSFVGPNV